MFYFYPEAPDINWFLKSRKNEIRILGVNNPVPKKDAYVKTTDIDGSKDFELTSNFVSILNKNTKISYPSMMKQRDEKLIVITPEWNLFWIFPQSEILLEFEWNNLKKVLKESWRLLYLSWVFDSKIEIIWNDEILTTEEKSWLDDVENSYKIDVISHLKNQISDSNMNRANNTIMYDIDGKIIGFLARMFPTTFGKNLDNYKEFQKYFDWAGESVDLSRYFTDQTNKESTKSIWWNLKENIDIWEDNIYGWFKKPEKR